jgi:hypothetical protein
MTFQRSWRYNSRIPQALRCPIANTPLIADFRAAWNFSVGKFLQQNAQKSFTVRFTARQNDLLGGDRWREVNYYYSNT